MMQTSPKHRIEGWSILRAAIVILVFGMLVVACGAASESGSTSEPAGIAAPTTALTATSTPTEAVPSASSVAFWELDSLSTGRDLMGYLTTGEISCIERSLGSSYEGVLNAPLSGQGGLLEGEESEAAPITDCLSKESLASVRISMLSVAAGGLSAATRDCVTDFLREEPDLVEALAQPGEIAGGPATLQVLACLSPEEASALTPEGEGPPPDTAGIQCLIEELTGTASDDRIIAVLSGADSSGAGLTMEESAMLGQAVEACGIETDFGFPEPADSSTPGIAEPPSDADDVASDSVASDSTGECAVGLILNPGDECASDDFTIRIREDGAAVLDGNIGGISMGNTVMDAQNINLNRFRASKSGSTWTIESLP